MSNDGKKTITLPYSMSVRELANELDTSAVQVIKILMSNGVMASINQQIDFDTAAVVATELGYTPQVQQEEEVKASHILVKVEKDATPEERAAAKKKIEEIRDKITKGGDFAKLAAEFSDCPSGKRDGGNLDWFGKGRMVPEFEAAAFKLKPGELSDIVETSFGYHIIKVTDKRAEKILGFDEVKEDLRQDLINREKGKKFMDWLKGQKEKVTFMNPEDKETN